MHCSILHNNKTVKCNLSVDFMFVCLDFVAVCVVVVGAAYFVVCVCASERVFVCSHQHSKQFPSHSIRLNIFSFRILKYCIELQALVSGEKKRDEQRIVLFMHSDFKCHTNENENGKKWKSRIVDRYALQCCTNLH